MGAAFSVAPCGRERVRVLPRAPNPQRRALPTLSVSASSIEERSTCLLEVQVDRILHVAHRSDALHSPRISTAEDFPVVVACAVAWANKRTNQQTQRPRTARPHEHGHVCPHTVWFRTQHTAVHGSTPYVPLCPSPKHAHSCNVRHTVCVTNERTNGRTHTQHGAPTVAVDRVPHVDPLVGATRGLLVPACPRPQQGRDDAQTTGTRLCLSTAAVV